MGLTMNASSEANLPYMKCCNEDRLANIESASVLLHLYRFSSQMPYLGQVLVIDHLYYRSHLRIGRLHVKGKSLVRQ